MDYGVRIFHAVFWRQIRPGIVRASQFEVVDGAGKTVAELSQKNGGAHLILYGTSHEPAGEFSVVGSDASIVLYDGEWKQRAALAMMVGAPTLVMHDAEGDVRALLTAGDYNSLFLGERQGWIRHHPWKCNRRNPKDRKS